MLRTLALAVAVLFLAPAAAHAVIGEEIVPYRDADDGVTVTTAGGFATVRFDRSASASAIWRKLAGRRVAVSCGAGAGEASGHSIRARNRRVRLSDAEADVCTLSTRGRRASGCLADDESARGRCVRLVVALTDAGREHIDEAIAAWDLLTIVGGLTEDGGGPDFRPLQEALGDKLVQLPDAAATPPPGVIGYWTDGSEDFAIVVLTAAGERRFVSSIDGVTATNGRGLLDLEQPSLLP